MQPERRILSLSVLVPLLAAAGAQAQTFEPIPLSMDSFVYDIVVEADASGPFSPGTSASQDEGVNNTNYTWYEQGYNTSAPWTGLPPAGTTVGSENSEIHFFKLPPDYTANNALLIDNTVTNGTLTVTTPAAYSTLSVLTAAGRGPVELAYTVRHADGTEETGVISSPDWHSADTLPAITANGRVNAGSGAFDAVDSGNPKLFAVDIALSNTTSPVTEVEFDFSTGGATSHATIFALSGATNGDFQPIDITGFNYDLVFEIDAPRAEPLFATNGSMDGGAANTGATWFERGYVASAPGSGLPPAGSSVVNEETGHSFILPPSYTEANAALVDRENGATLNLANPAAYSAIALLSSSGGGALTVDYTINHTTGDTQTGLITIPDWFNNTPYVLVTSGRVAVATGALSAMGTENPRLYAVEIPVERTTTPIASIVLTPNDSTGTGHAAVFAVSGALGVVRPIFSVQPASISVLEGETAQFSATVGGDSPIAFQWQRNLGSGYVNVTGANVSGANTAELTLNNVARIDAGAYILVASNAGGAVTSQVAQLNVVSTIPDVTSPSDEITSFGGNSPDAEQVINAIDDTTTKYLNFGNDGDTSAPFVGPIGLVVTPAVGPTVVTALRIYTANDAVDRDPADFILEGSNDGQTFREIASGPLQLPATRNAAGQALDPLTQANQEIHFSNNAAYTTYRLTFTHAKNDAAVNSIQVGEVEFLGAPGQIRPELTIQRAGPNQVTLSWTEGGRLQSATELGEDAEWTDVQGTSPVTVDVTGATRFFRVAQ